MRKEISNKPLVILSFDDARSDFYDIVFPILKQRGLSCTLNVTTGYVDHTTKPDFPSACSIQQIKEMSNYGIEMAMHGDKHLHLETVEDMSICYDKISSWTLQPIQGIAMPYTNRPTKDLLSFFKQKKIRYCRLGTIGSKRCLPYFFYERILFPITKKEHCLAMAQKNNFFLTNNSSNLAIIHAIPITKNFDEHFYFNILKTLKPGSSCTLIFHSIGNEAYLQNAYFNGGWTISTFQNFLDLCQKNDMVFVKEADLFKEKTKED